MKQLLICYFYYCFIDYVKNSKVFIATSFLSHQGFFIYHLLTLTFLEQLVLLHLHVLILETCCNYLSLFIYSICGFIFPLYWTILSLLKKAKSFKMFFIFHRINMVDVFSFGNNNISVINSQQSIFLINLSFYVNMPELVYNYNS